MNDRRSYFIVGPGRLGCSLGYALSSLNDVELTGIAFHSRAGLVRAQQWLPSVPAYPLDQIGAARDVDVVLLTVRDDVIAQTATTLSDHLEPNQVLLHTSGLLSADVMRSSKSRAALGSFHPLQTFTTPTEATKRFSDCFVACEGDERAVSAGLKLGGLLGSETVVISSQAKIAYHAAAVVASNYLVVVSEAATTLAAEAGIDGEMALRMLAPLQRGALASLEQVGLPEALTGPIARGDVETVSAHLDLIGCSCPELLPVYTELGRLAVDMAERLGQDRKRLDEILELLER